MRARPVVILLVIILATAGCMGGRGPRVQQTTLPTSDSFTPFDPSNTPPTPTTVPGGTGSPPSEPGPIVPGQPAALFAPKDTKFAGSEPTMGITKSGAVFVTARERLLRSDDRGETWQDVTAPQQALVGSFDPYVWIDTTTDRVFHVNLQIATSYLTFSDNEGSSWTNVPAAGGPGDHQKLATVLPSESIPGAGVLYDNVVYYLVNQNPAMTWVSQSLDGGTTWGPEVPIAPNPAQCGSGGIAGQPHGTANGAVLIPYYDCSSVDPNERTVWVARSLNGQQWSRTEIDFKFGGGENDPDLAHDLDGNVYLAYMGGAAGNWSVYLSLSSDEGARWSKPIRVPPEALGSTIFPTIVAGAPGELWISYLATDDTTADPNAAPDAAEWYLYTTHVSGADTDTPVHHTYLVDPHPVQIGRISTEGLTPEDATGGDDDRNLLEFIDSALDLASGRLYIVYTDGCPASCDSKADSNAADIWVARMDLGPNVLSPGTSVPFPG